MKKVLIVLTNTTRYEGTQEPTGLWLGEAAEFYDELSKVGITADFVSPKGGFVPLDPRSMKYTDNAIMKVYETTDFQKRALQESLAAGDLSARSGEYGVIYYTGGHGVMWDFPDDENLQQLAAAIYEQGGIVSSVCHGIAGLLNVKDSSGVYLISGKAVTGFTKAEEILAGKLRVVPFLNREEVLKRGGIFRKKRFYSDHSIQDGRLITGQNPFSVRSTAKLVIKELTR